MPSKRPASSSTPGPFASSRTMSWVRGSPRGDKQMRGDCGLPATTWSMAAPRTSARKIMPAPPPAGVSSTARCRPNPNWRMPIASSAQRPCFRASPASDADRGPGKSSGKSVSTVARQGARACVPPDSVKLGCSFDDHEVEGARTLPQLLGGCIFRRACIGLRRLETRELDDDVAGDALPFHRLHLAAAHDGVAAVFLHGLAGLGGIFGPGGGVRDVGSTDDIALGHGFLLWNAAPTIR